MPEVNDAILAAAEKARADKLTAMQQEWPKEQKVELTGGDYPGNQGVVLDVVEKAMVPYVRVQLLVYGTGRRRPEGKQPLYDMRATSLKKIDEFKAEPAPTPAPVAAPTETAKAEEVAPKAESPADEAALEQEIEQEIAAEEASTGW